MENKDYRIGPVNIVGEIGGTVEFPAPSLPFASDDDSKVVAAQAAIIAAAIVGISNAPSLLEKWTNKRINRTAAVYTQALQKPEVLWTVAACQLFVGNFPDINDARTLLAIMYSESTFNPTILNPINAYGLMQIIPSNVENISKWPLAQKLKLISKISPVVNWVNEVDPEIAVNMIKGQWPESLLVAAPLWQIPYIAVMWKEAVIDASRAFKWDGTKWLPVKEGKYSVKTKPFLDYMENNEDIFSSFDEGRVAILANLWKHGAPRGLRGFKPTIPLAHLNDQSDDITPVVEHYHNLTDHSSLNNELKALMKEVSTRSSKKSDSPFLKEVKKIASDASESPSFLQSLQNAFKF